MKKLFTIFFTLCFLLTTMPCHADNNGSLEFLTSPLSEHKDTSMTMPVDDGTPLVMFSFSASDRGHWLISIQGTDRDGQGAASFYFVDNEIEVVLYVTYLCCLWDDIVNEYGFSSFTIQDMTHEQDATGQIIIDNKEKADDYLLLLKEQYPQYKDSIEELQGI